MPKPVEILETLVLDYHEGRIGKEQFLQDLQNFDDFVYAFEEKLAQMRPPEEFPEGSVMVQYSADAFAQFAEVVNRLRGYAETLDPEEANAAIDLAREASDNIDQIQSTTEQEFTNQEFYMG